MTRVVRKSRGPGNAVSKMRAVGRAGWEVQRERQAAYQFIEPLDEAINLEMVTIPAGTFMMGSSESESQRNSDEGPQYEVSLAAFSLAKYPVTQAQWRFVAGLDQINRELNADPSHFKGDERPVETVSWHEAVEFCDRLSHHTGNEYNLPTEAQWEYACRAGTTTPFHFGDTILPKIANYSCTESYGNAPRGKHRQQTTPVDEFDVANAFGLCDMHGNVWEWCADHRHDTYENAPTDGSTWLSDDEDAIRVTRGGSWSDNPAYCRSATRHDCRPGGRHNYIGFRVCCAAPRALQPSAG